MATTEQSNANIQKLISQGVPESYIRDQLALGKKGLARGKKIDDKDVNSFLQSWMASDEKSKIDAQKFNDIPDALKNDLSFQNLSMDQKEIVAYNYKIQQQNNEQKIKALNQALEQATAQADPYWRQIVRIAQMEVTNGLLELQGDYVSQNENLKRQIGYIQEDLERNRGVLSIEQQKELGSLAADLIDRQKSFELNMNQLGAQKASQLDSMELEYRKSIDDINRNTTFTQEEKRSALDKINRDFVASRGQIIGSAAEAGLTFSTKRKIAEQRLNEENKGIVESTMRTYNKQLADLVSSTNYVQSQYGLQKGNIEQEYQFSTEQQRQAMDTSERKVQEERDRIQRQYAQQIAELETDASRGNVQAQAQMVDLKRKLESSLASAGLAAEKYLGTENMPVGAPVVGGITGGLYEEKTRDIEARKQALYGELTQSSLNF